MQPKSMKWKEKDGIFVITWQCGRVSAFPLAFLRKHCPCATCKDSHGTEQKRDPFRLLPPASRDPHQAISIDPVGRYAIRISWADGHATGIYSFEVLKELSHQLEAKDVH